MGERPAATPRWSPIKKPVRTERKIFVCIPAAYRDGTAAPLMIIHDGPGPLGLVRNTLDNLTISKDPKRSLPPFIAIAVENGGNDGKVRFLPSTALQQVRHNRTSANLLVLRLFSQTLTGGDKSHAVHGAFALRLHAHFVTNNRSTVHALKRYPRVG
jgi:hypothetical protein